LLAVFLRKERGA